MSSQAVGKSVDLLIPKELNDLYKNERSKVYDNLLKWINSPPTELPKPDTISDKSNNILRIKYCSPKVVDMFLIWDDQNKHFRIERTSGGNVVESEIVSKPVPKSCNCIIM